MTDQSKYVTIAGAMIGAVAVVIAAVLPVYLQRTKADDIPDATVVSASPTPSVERSREPIASSDSPLQASASQPITQPAIVAMPTTEEQPARPPAITVATPMHTASEVRSSGKTNTKITHDVAVELVSARLADGNLQIGLKLTSQGDDKRVILSASRGSRVVVQGEVYVAEGAKIGGEAGSGGASATLIADIPFNAQIVFKKLPGETRVLDVVEIGIVVSDRPEKIQFRNVALAK